MSTTTSATTMMWSLLFLLASGTVGESTTSTTHTGISAIVDIEWSVDALSNSDPLQPGTITYTVNLTFTGEVVAICKINCINHHVTLRNGNGGIEIPYVSGSSTKTLTFQKTESDTASAATKSNDMLYFHIQQLDFTSNQKYFTIHSDILTLDQQTTNQWLVDKACVKTFRPTTNSTTLNCTTDKEYEFLGYGFCRSPTTGIPSRYDTSALLSVEQCRDVCTALLASCVGFSFQYDDPNSRVCKVYSIANPNSLQSWITSIQLQGWTHYGTTSTAVEVVTQSTQSEKNYVCYKKHSIIKYK